MGKHAWDVILGLLVTGVILAVAIMVLPAWDRPHSQWTDPAAHIVDGYWVSAEGEACRVPACSGVLRVAVEHAPTVAATTPIRAVRTTPAQEYLDSHGQADIGLATSGLSYPNDAIIEYDDGTRRMVGVWCGPIPDPAAPNAPPIEECRPGDVLAYRVGEEPWR